MEIKPFYNLYRVDEFVFRSEQPTQRGMYVLDSLGYKSILNLRNLKSDRFKARNTRLGLYHKRINTWTISYDEMVIGVKELILAPKPILVHCKHGSDRTGCILAAYRIVQHGWTKEEAIKEFREGGYGFHEKWFKNIIRLLEKINEEQLRKDVEKAKLMIP
jgi:protein tyrosine/serine phosphatase